MSGTNKTARTPPPRRFENYILTRTVDSTVGLTSVSEAQFIQIPGSAGASGEDDAQSNPIQIGFNFSFDGIDYKQFVVSTNGWMTLVDPSLGTFSITEITTGSSWQNSRIRETFTSNAVLLSPWFDDLANTSNNLNDLSGPFFGWSSTKINRISSGLEQLPNFINQNGYAIRYFNDNRSTKGRRLIVRWTQRSNYVWPTSVINFEVVLYENGTIEYRYAPRYGIARPPSISDVEAATIGIFMPNGTNRFRDFSAGLGYREDSRQEYIYGGYTYTSTYHDSSTDDTGNPAPYTVNLSPYKNWPGLNTAGCIMTFSPPLNRRKVLPRKLVKDFDNKINFPLVARTGDSRLGTSLVSFDDRKSPNYTISGSALVNYPTTLPRFFGGTGHGTLQRQDLFSGDFLVTGSVVKSAFDQYVDEKPIQSIDAFNESALYEQNNVIENSFFTIGSNTSHVANGFDGSLKSKTQIRIAFPINANITMPGLTSSIYYYNQKTKSWQVPFNSSYVLDNSGNTPPTPNPRAGGDWAYPGMDAFSVRQVIEDARGFGPIGNIISSGTHVPVARITGDQTDSALGSQYSFDKIIDVIGKNYPKSIRNNEEYKASSDETFTLPINAPFLIEKAIFEIPFKAGPGWFNDVTQCFWPGPVHSDAYPFDFAGPALTVALYRQVQLSENANGVAIRDLILTGTITHQNDNIKTLIASTNTPTDPAYEIRPVGFLAYANPPSAVVKPNNENSFTGSVKIETTALSSAGVIVKFAKSFTNASTTTVNQNILAFSKSPKLTLKSDSSDSTQIQDVSVVSIAPFGRGGTGFNQAGRAILGNEYVTLQGLSDQTGRTCLNPFSGSNSDTLNELINDNSHYNVTVAVAAVSLITHFASPYLVMPGDKLVLSISKTRPIVNTPQSWNGSSYVDSPSTLFSGSIAQQGGHDVTLMTGTINITLYGSQVQRGVEYHDTLNQSLGSDIVHELIGAEPVLDQFESAYRNEYSGSFTDNVMMGSLSNTGTSRHLVISKLQATTNSTIIPAYTVSNPDAGIYAGQSSPATLTYPARKVITSTPATLSMSVDDVAINKSKAYRAQPWTEQKGDIRLTQLVDSTERYWDSMMPAVNKCFDADNCGIFIAPYGSIFGDYRQVNNGTIVPTADSGATTKAAYDPNKDKLGWIIFDLLMYDLPSADLYSLINGNWNKSFPFEPRYDNISRQVNIANSFLATKIYQPYTTPIVKSIPPTNIQGLLFGTNAIGTAVGSYNNGANYYTQFLQTTTYEWFSDVNLSGKIVNGDTSDTFPSELYSTGSASTEDICRALFGFGDRNTLYAHVNADTSISYLGTTHSPDCRDQEGPHPDGAWDYVDASVFKYSPVIRGWKYGVHSGLPTFNKAYWRRGKFGQFRDMIEQRQYGKFYQISENSSKLQNSQQGVGPAAVTVTFIDQSSKRLTSPENTWSSNLHFECTSSLPFFDGIASNRPTITGPKDLPILRSDILNLHPNTILHDSFGNIRIS